jgi:lipopolysaccharide biosynthesis glycosyltransferase
VMIAVGLHLFPFRTEKLKPPAPKILEEISGKIGRRRDIVHNIYFYILSTNIFLILFSGYPTPWTSPIALSHYSEVQWSSPGHCLQYLHIKNSLVFSSSFRYNPTVLKWAERGFSLILEITA